MAEYLSRLIAERCRMETGQRLAARQVETLQRIGPRWRRLGRSSSAAPGTITSRVTPRSARQSEVKYKREDSGQMEEHRTASTARFVTCNKF